MQRRGSERLKNMMDMSPLKPVLERSPLPRRFKAYVLAMSTMAISNQKRRG